jgi:hypothetical protein
MAESMVERVRAALKAVSRDDFWCDYLTDHEAIVYARAAIAAMREPTEAMVNGWDDPPCSEIWRSMIDVALATSSDEADTAESA